MGLLDIFLIAIGLSMDAAAVSAVNALSYEGLTKNKKVQMAVVFGAFQGFMPVLGYLLGGLFAESINQYAGVLTFVVLGVIGVAMIKDGFSVNDEEKQEKNITTKMILIQAVVTSIDAFAVGVSFSVQGTNIIIASSVIAVTTALCCLVAIKLGKKFGSALGNKAQQFGGAVLLLIAIKALFN